MDSAQIVCDIGGTFARFAVVENGVFKAFHQYRAAEHDSFLAALNAYSAEAGLVDKLPVLIATAAYEDGPVWRFINQNEWVIDTAALKAAGWRVDLILNDFAAATWGLLALDETAVKRLNEYAINARLPRCLLGPGTGLGLGYLYPLEDQKYHVQRTHGGHMPAAAVTAEQASVIEKITQTMPQGDAVVYETLVSGPGLVNIYNALSAHKVSHAQDVLAQANTEMGKKTIRLFHEFWGLFAATSVICGHAYGGLYLTGGMSKRLDDAGLLDMKSFMAYFTAPWAVSVREALEATPIALVTDPHLSFKGLLAAFQGGA